VSIKARKSQIKLLLFTFAIVLAGVTLWYTNEIANTIAKEEEQKVRIWADAIIKKANLVRVTHRLFKRLSEDERKKVYNYSRATQLIIKADDKEPTFNFLLEILQSNENIPVIQTDEDLVVKNFRNLENGSLKVGDTLSGSLLDTFSQYPSLKIDYEEGTDIIFYKDSKIFSDLKNFLNSFFESFISEIEHNTSSLPVIVLNEQQQVVAKGNVSDKSVDHPEKLSRLIQKMKKEKSPIAIDLGDGIQRTIYYTNSPIISKLKLYPVFLILAFGLFIGVSYYVFSTTRKAEQNLVWVGMAKETAHQLGTPISSLAAWIELMKEKEGLDEMDQKLIFEIEKDVNRLSLISDRFSKIGAKPKLEEHNVYEVLNNSIDYIKSRASKRVQFDLKVEGGREQTFFINVSLFDWVIENLLKNALDAIEGKGEIKINAIQLRDDIIIEIQDNGKGISLEKLKFIFDPGYSSKHRGWGLGLTLCKRIVENYFKGKIYVKNSEPGKGTTFVVQIPV
jgi:two-component system, sporulation sensor kinase D